MDFGDKYYWRQILVVLGMWFQSMTCGVVLAYPTVLNSKYNDATGVNISDDQASWLASTVGITGPFGLWIVSAIFELYGRKVAHLFICISQLSSWVVFYFATSITWLFIARILQSFPFGALYINSVIMSEYADPMTRGYFMTLAKVFMASGSLICHWLSFWTWREAAAAGGVMSFLSVVFTMCWPESPSFYALNGRFEECTKVFTWLHGSSIQKKKELAALVAAQMEELKLKKRRNSNRAKAFFKTFAERDFQKSCFLAALVLLALDTCGRYFVVAYIIQIMVELVGKEHAVFYTITVDCIIIMSLIISCFLVRYINRRTLLFLFGSINVALMFSVTFVSYLNHRSVRVSNIVWLTPTLLLLQNFVVNASVVPVCFCLSGEVFPLEFRSAGTLATGLLFCFMYAIVLKATPVMLTDLGLGGTYATYGLILALTLIAMFFTVPETKNRPLQDIEDEMRGVTRNAEKVLMKLREDSVNELNVKFIGKSI